MPQVGEAPMDDLGNFQYIVNLHENSADGYAEVARDDDRFPSYDKGQVRNLIYEFEAKYGIEVKSLTSWVGPSFSAFLNSNQIAALRYDERVELISPNYYMMGASADAKSVWVDQDPSGNEKIPWGRQAMNPFAASSNGTVRVYVIDFGVGFHSDLNVVQRVNPFDPEDPKWANVPICYHHGSHVAGIIGAKANGAGAQGVNPGASIVSVLLRRKTLYNVDCTFACEGQHNNPEYNPNCNDEVNVLQALDWVTHDVWDRKQLGVVNLSFNSSALEANTPMGKALLKLARNPEIAPNALIANSAGNDFDDACMHAFGPQSDSDGIMVVGAINDHGQQVVPLNEINGFRAMPLALDETGSNYGPCVDAWAPGQLIYSTWKNDGYAFLSGTSMAAPHIAGLAAYIAETEGAVDAADLESKVRAKMKPLGSYDHANLPIQMATLAPLPNPSNTTYAEVAFDGKANPDEAVAYYDPNPVKLLPELKFQSIGSNPNTCDLYRTQLVPAGEPELLPVTSNPQSWDLKDWSPGTWTIDSLNCPSAHAEFTLAKYPAVHWYVDGVEQTPDQVVTIPTDGSKVLSYTSENSASCTLGVYYDYIDNFEPPPPTPVPDSTVPASNPNVTIINDPPPTKDWSSTPYRYLLTCKNVHGASAGKVLHVTTPSPSYASKFIAHDPPQEVGVGQLITVNVTLKNTGTTPWTEADSFRLGAVNPADNKTWGWNRVKLDPGETITIGKSKTFKVNVLAPVNPGVYSFQWQMVKDGTLWFGQPSPPTPINVTLPVSLIQPASGIWHNPNRPGPKLFVSRNDKGQVLFLWNTFTEGGKPIWYYGLHGQKNQGVYSSDQTPEGMFVTQWGKPVSITTIGQMYYAPISSTKGTFSWIFQDSMGDKIGAEVSEYEAANGGASLSGTGHWYAPGQGGWGVSFDLRTDSAKTLVYFYDDTGKPTWAYGTGTASGNGYSFPALEILTGNNLCPGCTGPTSVSSVSSGWLTVDTANALLGTSLVPFPGAPSLQGGNLPIQLLTY